MFVYKIIIYILLFLYIYKFEKEKDFFFYKYIFLFFFGLEKLKINNFFSFVFSFVLYGSVVSYVIFYCIDIKYFVFKML